MSGSSLPAALIVEDHPAISQSVSIALMATRAFASVDSAHSLDDARALLLQRQYGLVMLDLHLADASGIEALVVLREEFPELPVVIYSADESVSMIAQAFELGVRGYVPKSSPMSVLASALQIVLAGSCYIPPRAAQLMGFQAPARAASYGGPTTSAPALSPRQTEVFQLLLKGMSNKRIALRLGMAEGTVKAHMNTIYRVLGVHNRAQAILRARELGLL